MSATPESVAPASPAEIAVTESQVPSAPLPGATILGYPRIGRDRELKRAVESFWKGNLSVDELRHAAAELREVLAARAEGTPAPDHVAPVIHRDDLAELPRIAGV